MLPGHIGCQPIQRGQERGAALFDEKNIAQERGAALFDQKNIAQGRSEGAKSKGRSLRAKAPRRFGEVA